MGGCRKRPQSEAHATAASDAERAAKYRRARAVERLARVCLGCGSAFRDEARPDAWSCGCMRRVHADPRYAPACCEGLAVGSALRGMPEGSAVVIVDGANLLCRVADRARLERPSALHSADEIRRSTARVAGAVRSLVCAAREHTACATAQVVWVDGVRDGVRGVHAARGGLRLLCMIGQALHLAGIPVHFACTGLREVRRGLWAQDGTDELFTSCVFVGAALGRKVVAFSADGDFLPAASAWKARAAGDPPLLIRSLDLFW